MTVSEHNRQTFSGPEKEPALSSRDLLTPLFERWRLFTIVFLAVLGLSGLAAFVLSHQYKAQIKILVNRERLDPTVTTQAVSELLPTQSEVTEEEINSEVELLSSRDLLEKVVLANHLQDREKGGVLAFLKPRLSEEGYISKAVQHLGNALKIQAVARTNMIQVSYGSSDPQLSYGVLKSLSANYMEKHLEVHRPQGSSAFFEQETEKYKNALEDAESKLTNFGKEQGVAAPDQQRSNLALKAADSVAELQTVKQAIAADEQRIQSDLAQMKSIPQRSSTLQVASPASELLQQLQAKLLDAKTNRAQLAMKFDPSYPLVRSADDQIAATEKAIANAEKQQYIQQTTDIDPAYNVLREDYVRTRSDLAAQRATAAALSRAIPALQAQMVDLDAKAVKQADLLREAKANESSYLLYLSKWQEERSSDALDRRQIANVALAEPPAIPLLPAYSPLPIMFVGFFLALAAGAGAAFVSHYFDSSFRTPDEVATTLRIPVLATFPRQVA